jgi:menaquinone-dependent protoporphyrinogen oxidase
MVCRVLVVYASRFGSTAGVAEAVAGTLRDSGFDVDVHPATVAPPATGYDAIVVGSAIYNTRWMPAATAYIKTHAEEINSLPSAYFQVCLSILNASGRKRKIIDSWMEPANRLAPPIAAATFPGALYRSKIAGGQRLLVWLSRIEDGDYRDWEAVRGWSESLAHTLYDETGCAERGEERGPIARRIT